MCMSVDRTMDVSMYGEITHASFDVSKQCSHSEQTLVLGNPEKLCKLVLRRWAEASERLNIQNWSFSCKQSNISYAFKGHPKHQNLIWIIKKSCFKVKHFSIVLPAWMLKIKERKQDMGISMYWVKKANKTISNHVFLRNPLTSNNLFYSIQTKLPQHNVSNSKSKTHLFPTCKHPKVLLLLFRTT